MLGLAVLVNRFFLKLVYCADPLEALKKSGTGPGIPWQKRLHFHGCCILRKGA